MSNFLRKTTSFLLIILLSFCMFSCDVYKDPSPEGPADDTPTITEEEIQGFNETELRESDPNWFDSYLYSNEIKNYPSGRYADPNRKTYEIKNKNTTINFDLSDRNKSVSSIINNETNKPYLLDTLDSYIEDEDGIHYTKNGFNDGRVNTYKQGYYYWNTHILNQNFNSEEDYFYEPSSYDLIQSKETLYTHDLNNRFFDNEGYHFTVENNYDPYVAFPSNFDSSLYSVVVLTMKNQYSNKAQLYIGTSVNGVTGDQYVSFDVIPNGEYNQYFIDISMIPNYVGTITTVRLDLGMEIDEEAVVKSIKFSNYKDDSLSFLLDRSFHAYSDKIHEETKFYCSHNTTSLVKSIGNEIKIPKSNVEKIYFGDKDNKISNLNGTFIDKLSFAAFKIKDVGVIGFITPYGNISKIKISQNTDSYIVNIYTGMNRNSFSKGDVITTGYRLYTDSSSTFENFEKEYNIEKNPITTSCTYEKTSSLGYDPLVGCYKFTVDGTEFNYAYSHPQKQFPVYVSLFNDNLDRNVYVLTHTDNGCLECAVVLDENNLLLPIETEVCKNFRGENEEPFFDPGDPSYGEVIVPIVLKEDEVKKFIVIDLYQNWGVKFLKQLSSIQFYAPYYHLSCGTTESNCISFQFINGKNQILLPDFRAMSAPFWSTQPQHTSAGNLKFLYYYDEQGNRIGNEYVEDTISSSGPTYVDIKLKYITDDGKMSLSLRHAETPQFDENRTYYEVGIEVLEDVTIKNLRENLTIFHFDGRNILYKNYAYLSKDGQMIEKVFNDKTNKKEYITLAKENPFFSFFDADNNDYVNFGLLIKDYDIKINGSKYTDSIIARTYYQDVNHMDLTLNISGNITLKKGDYININMILLPFGSQETLGYESVKTVLNDSIISPTKISAKIGSIVSDNYIPKIKVENDTTEFTIIGGPDVMTVCLMGFKKRGKIYIEHLVNGVWEKYVTNYFDYDGYFVTYDIDGFYSYSFVYDLDGMDSKTFRVSIQ